MRLIRFADDCASSAGGWRAVAADDRNSKHYKAANRGGLLPTTTFVVLLDRRARHGAVRAEHAAVSSQRLKPGATGLAVVKELARIGRHRLGCLVPTDRASQGRFKLHTQAHKRTQDKRKRFQRRV
jgi:hypothetical protein